jgi:hypothetical protein
VYWADANALGGVATIDYTSAPVLAALVAGPYRYQIEKNLGALTIFNIDNADKRSGRVRIYRVSGSGISEGEPSTYTVVWVANGLKITLPAEENVTLLLEIRLIHSSRR